MLKKQSKKVTGIEEYVLINGIHQYLFHAGTADENPVLLFLHGGPGSAASLFAHAFQDNWEELYTCFKVANCAAAHSGAEGTAPHRSSLSWLL